MEMLLIFVVVLMLFGGEKLPEFARGLGKTMREFKKAASGVEEEFKRAMEEDERKRIATTVPPATGTPDTASPSYPEDGTTDYSSEAGPTAASGSETPASPAATSTETTPATATPVTGEGQTAETKTSPTAPTPPAATPLPVAHEDYP